MNVQVVMLAPIRVALLKHVGPYEGINPVFDRLWKWVESNNVPVGRTIGAFWDNPEFVEASRLRSAACVELPADYQITNAQGAGLTVDQIHGGEYATTRYVGPYEEMEPAWSRLTNHVENSLGRRVRQNPALEVYVNDPSDTPPHQLITDLYLPID